MLMILSEDHVNAGITFFAHVGLLILKLQLIFNLVKKQDRVHEPLERRSKHFF